MKEYIFTIVHDKGKHKITTYAQTLSQALVAIMNAERCPERAIINIKINEINEEI